MKSATEFAVEAAKAAPPVSVSGLLVFGFPLSEWAIGLTIIYTLMQIYFSLSKHLRERKHGRN